MKNHLKRIASPRTWLINRKQNKFTVRPKPGAHSLEQGLALGIVVRDLLKLASTMTEVKKLLNDQEILVDGKRRKDNRFITGLFDVITIPVLKKSFRVLLDAKGRIIVKETLAEESLLKPCKIVGKTVLSKGKIQFNLHDGKNLIGEYQAKVGDTLMLELPSLAVKEILVRDKGVAVFLTKGKNAGNHGFLKEIKNTEAILNLKGKEIETTKKYLFVVGKKESAITLG